LFGKNRPDEWDCKIDEAFLQQGFGKNGKNLTGPWPVAPVLLDLMTAGVGEALDGPAHPVARKS
jgi:hypothetical protein